MSLQSVPLKTILAYHADTTNETLPTGYAYCDGSTLAIGTHDIGGGVASYTLPDLRNRFLLGADITKGVSIAGGTTNSASDAPGPKGSGGTHAKSLATAELPAHTHTATTNSAGAHTHAGSTADTGGSHSHSGSTSTNGAHTHSGTSAANAGAHSHSITDPGHSHTINTIGWVSGGGFGSGSSGYANPPIVVGTSTTGITINSNGDHTHAITITSDGDHAHTLTIAAGGTHSHTLTLVSDGGHVHSFTTDATGGGTAFDTRPRYYGVVYIMKVKN